MPNLEFTNCRQGTIQSNGILFLAVIFSAFVLISSYFLESAWEVEIIILCAIILTIGGLILNDRRKRFDVIIDQDGIQIRNSKSQNQVQRLQKGEFLVNVTSVNITPPSTSELDLEDPILVHEVILRANNRNISLKRFDDHEDAVSMRNAILELIN